MPNSPWTETGSSISLVPSTTTIGSDPENVNYLSNQDKINLMAQYTAELAMKTSLDTLASTWSVSSTFYNNAVAAISTALINAGAPSNWATTWPDGTTSGPWTGIQTSLANLWAQVATQRTALQSYISAAQAAQAQAAAVATAASAATTQMNAAIAQANAAAATAQANAIAAANTAANNAQDAAMSATIAMAASESIVPNGGFETGDLTGFIVSQGGGAWSYGSLLNSQNGLVIGGGTIGIGSAPFRVTPGRTYMVSFAAWAGSGSQAVSMGVNYTATNVGSITAANRAGTTTLYPSGTVASSPGAAPFSATWTCPAGVYYASVTVVQNGGTATVFVPFVYCVPMVDAAYISAGAVTANALAANAVTASSIAAGSITAQALAAGAVTTTALAAGSVNTTVLAANAVTAQNIAAGAITVNKLAVTPTGATINYDPAMNDPSAWYQATGNGALGNGVIIFNAIVAGNPGAVGSTCLNCYSGNYTEVESVATYGIDSTKVYKLSANLFSAGTNLMVIYVRFYNTAGTLLNTSWGGTTGNTYAGVPPNDGAFHRCGGQFGAGTSYPMPVGTVSCRIGLALQWGIAAVAVQAIQDFRLEAVVDGSLIVDGSITATKIAAGAITADMITTGTLNAVAVNITNINASNITTGTLSASKVLFADGTALTTASRVQTSMLRETATATTSGAGNPGTAIAGLTCSVTAASTADTFNMFGALSGGQTVGTPGYGCNVNLYVDGTFNQSIQVSYATLNSTQSNAFIMSLTGLSAGTHALTFYLQAANASQTFQSYVGSTLLLQRVF